MIAKKFYTGPRFRRHTIKAPDWQKILSTAHQIPNPLIAKKFYTGPRFRRHTIKAPDWQKILSTAHQIPNPFWRGFTVTFVLAFKEALEKRRAMAQ